MPRDVARDAWSALGDMVGMPPLLQRLVGGGEAVEAAQIIDPGVADEVLDEALGPLDVLEETPRDRTRAQPRAARFGHDFIELRAPRRIDVILDGDHQRAVAQLDRQLRDRLL